MSFRSKRKPPAAALKMTEDREFEIIDQWRAERARKDEDVNDWPQHRIRDAQREVASWPEWKRNLIRDECNRVKREGVNDD